MNFLFKRSGKNFFQTKKTENSEEKSRIDEEKLKAGIKDKTELICLFLPDGTLTFVSDAYCRFYGKTREALLGKRYFELVPKEIATEDKERLSKMTPKNSVVEVEHRAIDKDGWHRWQHWTTQAIFGKNNKVIEYQSVGRDITAEKYTEEALRKSEEKYRDLVDNSLVGIFRANVDGNYVYANEAMARMFGFDNPDELIRESAKIRYENLADRDEFLRRLKENGSVTHYELTGLTKSGKKINVLSNATLSGNEISGMLLDITKRKKAEEALVKSEERYRKLVEMSPEAIFINRDNKIIFINQAGVRFFGAASAEQILGRSPFDFFHTDYRPMMEEKIKRLLSGEKISLVEGKCRRVDGTEIFAEIVASLFSDERGQSIQVMLHNITERKAREKRIRNLTRLYSVLYKVIEVTIRIQDEGPLLNEICRIIAEEGKFPLVWTGNIKGIDVCPSASAGKAVDYLKEIQIKTEGKLGQGPTGTCIREKRPVVNDDFDTNSKTAPWQKAAQLYGFRSSAAFPLVRENRVVGALTLYSGEPSVFDSDQINLLEALAADISYALESLQKEKRRIKAEAAVINAKEEWERTFDSISDLIFILDINHTIIKANKALLDFFKKTEEEIIGKKCYEVVHKMKQPWMNCPLLITKASGQPYTEEVDDPSLGKVLLVTTSPIMDSRGRISGIAHIAKDITERKKMEKAKDEFISLASHQLRTPLSSIALSSELLLRGVAGETVPAQKEYLEEIYKATKRMTLLVSNLLNVSRVEMGNFELKPGPFDVASAVSAVVKEFSPLTADKKLDFHLKIDDTLPVVNLDEKSFGIIFENLLSNAIRYTPKKGTISIELRKNKSGALLSVSDTGCGIPAGQQKKIFQKSFRAENAREISSEGAGLGLYMSHIAAQRSGVKIWFESEEGKGTTFFVLFPSSQS